MARQAVFDPTILAGLKTPAPAIVNLEPEAQFDRPPRPTGNKFTDLETQVRKQGELIEKLRKLPQIDYVNFEKHIKELDNMRKEVNWLRSSLIQGTLATPTTTIIQNIIEDNGSDDGTGGGTFPTTFIELDDTPTSYTGEAWDLLHVNSDATGVAFDKTLIGDYIIGGSLKVDNITLDSSTIYSPVDLNVETGSLGIKSTFSQDGTNAILRVDKFFNVAQTTDITVQQARDAFDIITQDNILVDGGVVTWVSGLTFDVSAAIYYIDGVRYTSAADQVTLDAEEAQDRIDVIYADTDGLVGAITGQAGSPPVEPATDPFTQLKLSAILVNDSGGGGGVDVTVTQIYDEDVEWTTSQSGAEYNFTDTTDPQQGTNHISTSTASTNDVMTFTSTDFDITDYEVLKFYIQNVSAVASNMAFELYWVNDGATLGTVTVQDGDYGYSRTSTGSYQAISIPLSDFALSGTTVDSFNFEVTKNGGGPASNVSIYVDNIQIQTGVPAGGTGQNIWKTFQADTGSTSADSVADILTVTGGTGISTSITDDELTISLTSGESLPVGTVTDSTLRWDGSDWVEETQVRIDSTGYMDFEDISAPSAPAAGDLRLWAEAEGGYSFFHAQDENSIDLELSRDIAHVVRNNTASTITKGSVVYVNGAQGTFPTVDLADADSSSTMPAFGVAMEDISASSFGLIIQSGDLKGLDLSAFSQGDLVYVSQTAGEFTSTKPSFPALQQSVGVVINNGAGSSGILGVALAGATALEQPDHGNLAGLTDDDHSQYLLLAGRGGQTVTDAITITGSLAVDNISLNANTITTTSGALEINTTSGFIGYGSATTANQPHEFTGNVLMFANTIWSSGGTITNAGVGTGFSQWNVDNLRLDGNTISTTDTNGDLTLTPDGTGVVYVNSELGIGTDSVPHAGVGIAKLAIEGTAISSAGPHVQFTTNTDNYPLLQILPYYHDNVNINFDSYWDGSNWRSSDAGSNFQITKLSDELTYNYNSGTAAGSTFTWTSAWKINTSGQVLLNSGSESAPSLAYDSDTNTGLYRIGSDNIGVSVGGNKVIDIASGGTLATTTEWVSIAGASCTYPSSKSTYRVIPTNDFSTGGYIDNGGLDGNHWLFWPIYPMAGTNITQIRANVYRQSASVTTMTLYLMRISITTEAAHNWAVTTGGSGSVLPSGTYKDTTVDITDHQVQDSYAYALAMEMDSASGAYWRVYSVSYQTDKRTI